MKTNNLTILLICLAALFISISCAKNSNDESVVNLDSSPYYANPNNPYDYVGVMHNEALSRVMEEVEGKSVVEIIESALKHSKDVLSENGLTRSISIDDLESMTEDEIYALLDDLDNNLENFIAELDMEDEAKITFQDLVNQLLDMILDAQFASEDAYSEVILFESQLIESSISESDQVTLLSGASTLRYSLAYWEEIYIGDDDDDDDDDDADADTLELAKRKWWKWIIIGLADAAGAVVNVLDGLDAAVAGAVEVSAVAKEYVDNI